MLMTFNAITYLYTFFQGTIILVSISFILNLSRNRTPHPWPILTEYHHGSDGSCDIHDCTHSPECEGRVGWCDNRLAGWGLCTGRVPPSRSAWPPRRGGALPCQRWLSKGSTASSSELFSLMNSLVSCCFIYSDGGRRFNRNPPDCGGMQAKFGLLIFFRFWVSRLPIFK